MRTIRVRRALGAITLVLGAAACGGATGDAASARSAKPLAVAVAGTDLPPPMPSAPLADDAVVRRIAIGSCFSPAGDHAVFDRIADTAPDAFLFLGDNVYAQTESASVDLQPLRLAYAELAASKAFARLRGAVPVLATWDDHDFGRDDAGGDFPAKYASEALFEHAWAVPDTDERRARDGVYFARTVGPAGRRVQFIVLDTRFFRSPLRPTDMPGTPGRERYLPDDDPSKTMLGDDQWAWLGARLAEPADLRIIASSIQVLADGNGWEGWHNLPVERRRLFRLVADAGASGVLLVSGDRHVSGFYLGGDGAPYPIPEFSSSSLNRPIANATVRAALLAEPASNRVGELYGDASFGLVDIDWDARLVRFGLRDASGGPVAGMRVRIDDLQAR